MKKIITVLVLLILVFIMGCFSWQDCYKKCMKDCLEAGYDNHKCNVDCTILANQEEERWNRLWEWNYNSIDTTKDILILRELNRKK